jgi:regulator of CtrA degradation
MQINQTLRIWLKDSVMGVGLNQGYEPLGKGNEMSTVSVLKPQKEYRPSELAARMIGSAEFRTLYAEVMELVEDTANFLDHEGRAASKLLGRHASVAYSKHSMELTTSLMRSASACLALRAAREGEMRIEDALKDVMAARTLARPVSSIDPDHKFPQRFTDLTEWANALQNRLKAFCDHLVSMDVPAVNAVHDSLSSLRLAFGTRF